VVSAAYVPDNGGVHRTPALVVMTLLVSLTSYGCARSPDLPTTVTTHSKAAVSHVTCVNSGDGVVTISGTLTGSVTARPHVGVAVDASVYGVDGRRLGQGLWPPIILGVGESKPFRMPVGTVLIEGQSHGPGVPPVPTRPTTFPTPVRCSIDLREYAIVDSQG